MSGLGRNLHVLRRRAALWMNLDETFGVAATLLVCLMLVASVAAPAVAAEPDVPNRSAALPYYNRANRYLSQGRFEDAERDLREAIRLYPDDADFHTNLGVTYRKLDKYADAEREFKIAIAFDRDDWMNWSNLANAYLKQNLLEKTIATFEETLKHKPPAKEVEAIKQDIIDIKKVLASQGGAPPAANKKTDETNKVQKSKTNSAAAQVVSKTAKTTSDTQNKSTTHSKTSRQNRTADSANINPMAPLAIPAESGKNKQSEWGYDDKKSP